MSINETKLREACEASISTQWRKKIVTIQQG